MSNDRPKPSPENHLRSLIASERDRAIKTHAETCRLQADNIPERLRSLELSYAKLTGFMVGSGLLGGVSGIVASKIIN